MRFVNVDVDAGASRVGVKKKGGNNRERNHQTTHGVIDAEMAVDGWILIVHAGTAMSTRTRQEPNSYNLISVDGLRISVTVMEWLPPAFRATATASYALADGHWQTA